MRRNFTRSVISTFLLLGLSASAMPQTDSAPKPIPEGRPIPGRPYRGAEFAAKLQAFDAKYKVSTRGENGSGYVNRGVGVFSEPLNGRDPFEVALQFFEENKDLFGMRDPRNELVVWKGGVPDKRTGVVHARFNQVLNGVRVDASHASARFGRDGALKSFDVTYTMGLDPAMKTVPQLTAQSVLEQSSAARQMGHPLKASKQELLIYQGKLTWFLRTSSGEYHIDANSGETLHWWDGKYYNKGINPPPPPRRTDPDSSGPLLDSSLLQSPLPHSLKQLDSVRTLNSVSDPDLIVPTDEIGRPLPRNLPPLSRGTAPSPEAREVEPGPKPEKGVHPRAPGRSWPGTVTVPPEWRPDSTLELDSSSASRSKLYSPNSIINILSEGFEGTFPSGSWTLYGTGSTWDDEACKPHSGNKSAWCAGSNQVCTGTYPNSMAGQMRFGPFNLSDAKSAHMSWWQWYDIEANFDSLFVGVSADGLSYSGKFFSGYSYGWIQDELEFCDYIGDGSVYVIFWFWSDDSYAFDGVYVDDVLIQKRTDGQPNLSGAAFPGWDWCIVVSNVPGTTTSSPITAGQAAYIDVAWGNFGVACADAHTARLTHEGVQIWSSPEVPSQAPGYGVGFTDITYTFAEPDDLDTLILEIDDAFQVSESDETDNVFRLILSVGCADADVNIGAGCSVVPGSYHSDVRTLCNNGAFFLADLSRVQAVDGYIETYRWIDEQVTGYGQTELTYSYNIDLDNEWDNHEVERQCQVADAHVSTGNVYDYMWNVFERDSYDSAGASMFCIVDDSMEWVWSDPAQQYVFVPAFDNAYWDPNLQMMVILRESDTTRSLAGCGDVIAHEWGHALTNHAANLRYVGESGALNESFSDMLAMAVAHANGDEDWLLAEDAFPSPPFPQGFAVRNIAEPWETPWPYGPQPYSYEGTYWIPAGNPCDTSDDLCGVHTNSGVPNRMFYLLTEGGSQNGFIVDGIGIIEAMYIMYAANCGYWEDTTRLNQALKRARSGGPRPHAIRQSTDPERLVCRRRL